MPRSRSIINMQKALGTKNHIFITKGQIFRNFKPSKWSAHSNKVKREPKNSRNDSKRRFQSMQLLNNVKNWTELILSNHSSESGRSEAFSYGSTVFVESVGVYNAAECYWGKKALFRDETMKVDRLEADELRVLTEKLFFHKNNFRPP